MNIEDSPYTNKESELVILKTKRRKKVWLEDQVNYESEKELKTEVTPKVLNFTDPKISESDGMLKYTPKSFSYSLG